jgi:hypothetical protein
VLVVVLTLSVEGPNELFQKRNAPDCEKTESKDQNYNHNPERDLLNYLGEEQIEFGEFHCVTCPCLSLD